MSQGESGSSGSPHPPTTSATGQSAPAPAPAPASVSAPPPSRQQQQQPAAQRLRRTGEAVLQSPTTSVKALLADTSAAPPPAPAPAPSGTGSSSSRDPLNDNDDDTTKSYSEAVKEGTPNEGDASAGGGGDGVGQATATTTSSRTATSSSSDDKEQGKAPPSSSQSHPTPPTTFVNTDDPSHRPTFQHTLHDLRQFLMPFLKLLPFQSLQGYIKVLIGPFVRFIVRVVAKILHRWNFGLASNLAYDIHLLLWKVSERDRGGEDMAERRGVQLGMSGACLARTPLTNLDFAAARTPSPCFLPPSIACLLPSDCDHHIRPSRHPVDHQPLLQRDPTERCLQGPPDRSCPLCLRTPSQPGEEGVLRGCSVGCRSSKHHRLLVVLVLVGAVLAGSGARHRSKDK